MILGIGFYLANTGLDGIHGAAPFCQLCHRRRHADTAVATCYDNHDFTSSL
jgi:hypothetical protein